jgi:hypothetical protein
METYIITPAEKPKLKARNFVFVFLAKKAIALPIPVEEEYLETPPGSLIYAVQPGDTLYIISLLFKVSIQRILELNNIPDPSLIHPGMKIILPEEAVNPFEPSVPGIIR